MKNSHVSHSRKQVPSPRSFTVTFILLLLFGLLGAHRFYLGRPVSGVLYFATFGFLGVGAFVDLIALVTGQLCDSQGLVVES